jgi:exodeoxyribonuclease VII small subunit
LRIPAKEFSRLCQLTVEWASLGFYWIQQSNMARKSVSAASPLFETPASTPVSFEAALEELEGLVESMSGTHVGLDQLLANYKRGAQLVSFCRSRLEVVRKEVAQVDQDLMGSDPSAGGA